MDKILLKVLDDIDINKLSNAINNSDCCSELISAGKEILRLSLRQKFICEMRNLVKFKYPVYVLSKLNALRSSSIKILNKSQIPFLIVIEPQDKNLYISNGHYNLLFLPEDNMGLSYARNFVLKYSREKDEEKHWQLDDDITGFSIYNNMGQTVTNLNITRGLSAIEEESDKYLNIAMSGPSNSCFSPKGQTKLIDINKLIASCILVNNACKSLFWSIDRVEDIDCCLSVLANRWCTLKFINILMAKRNDLEVSGNYTSFDKYKESVKTIMNKWPNTFLINPKTGKLRTKNNVWSKFPQRPIYKDNRNINTIEYFENILK